jgi:hypothetical protein
MTVSVIMIRKAGRLKKVVTPGSAPAQRQRNRDLQAEAAQQRLEVAGPADRHGRSHQTVFEDQVPAYHPRHQFTQNGVAVSIDTACHRQDGSKFGIAQRKAAGKSGDENDRASAGPAVKHRYRSAQKYRYRQSRLCPSGSDQRDPALFQTAARTGCVHGIEILGSKNTHYHPPLLF